MPAAAVALLLVIAVPAYQGRREAGMAARGERGHQRSPCASSSSRTGGWVWPTRGGERAPPVRGFNVVLWRGDDLGYALVSDLNASELRMLAERLSPPA